LNDNLASLYIEDEPAAQPVPDALVLDFVKSETRGTTVRTTYRCLSEKAGPMPLRLYAAAHPQPAPQPLTDERILNIAKTIPPLETCEQEWLHFAHRLLFAAGILPAPTTGEGQ
jgi:hypothetical protein